MYVGAGDPYADGLTRGPIDGVAGEMIIAAAKTDENKGAADGLLCRRAVMTKAAGHEEAVVHALSTCSRIFITIHHAEKDEDTVADSVRSSAVLVCWPVPRPARPGGWSLSVIVQLHRQGSARHTDHRAWLTL